MQRSDTGITPADAGKTPCVAWTRQCLQDHPRGCGENIVRASPALRDAGSPPRMRGKRHEQSAWRAFFRITPADAGKTCRPKTRQSARRDHPRGCGENQAQMPQGKSSLGSPPRMRGKRHQKIRYHYRSGITPADAGKTQFSTARSRSFTDHPRGCGENTKKIL